MRKITFDIETKNTFQDKGSANPADLDLSIVCIHDSEDDSYICYLEEELPELWKRIEKTDMLIGYNSDHFDIPILNKYYQGDLNNIKSLDLLKEIKSSFGKRLKLDDVARSTLNYQKNGHGLQAITWWKQGEIDKIKEYCKEDVKITKELYEYALKNGKVMIENVGKKQEIPLDTSNWEEKIDSSVTQTMPF